MTEVEHDVAMAADLEDGEIESDGEEESIVPCAELEPAKEMSFKKNSSKEEKKKKSKSHKHEKTKNKEMKNKKKRPDPVDDDFAGNIEKAIRRAMKAEDCLEEQSNQAEIEEQEDENGDLDIHRKGKKRKKHDNTNSAKKKRRRKHLSEELNDDEMMFTRGASPIKRSPTPLDCLSEESCVSEDESYDDHRNHRMRPQRIRQPHFKDRKNNKNNRDRRRDNIHPMQDSDGVCIYFMQGKCHKGDDCAFSHNAQPPRKMELCKFYLMDCCAKRDKCLYMHSDFPCKYYHTGLPCIFKDDCKFAHGPPLNDAIRLILLKHIESAPKEILGDFPRLSRESANMMVASTQNRLAQQYSSGSQELGIPSIFELNVPKPNMEDIQNSMIPQYNQYCHEKNQMKNVHKMRPSRWQQNNSVPNMSNIVGNPIATQDILSIRNLTGVLTPRQISDLTGLGIETLNDLTKLTVIQLNQLGLNLKQINEIQLNSMSIQRLGLIDGGDSTESVSNFTNSSVKDLDMRVPPAIPEVDNKLTAPSSETSGYDVDMRFQSNQNISENETTNESKPQDPRLNKDTIDIDQYTKDALKFALKEKENIDNISNDLEDNDDFTLSIPKSKDVDQRVLQYVKEPPLTRISDADTDIRFLHPENFSKKPEKRHRRSTTDDEDNNLLIDEKWYSSDEEKATKHKSPKSSPNSATPPYKSPSLEPASVLNKLGDLSKIDISDEVTKLLTTMKNNLQENKGNSPSQEHSKPRDPRSLPKKSPEHRSPSLNEIHKKPHIKISIYECVEGEPTDGRKRNDVDLRQLDPDFKLNFGDIDLRTNASSGDIDFRYGLPFKPVSNYTPATEIDGSINCHPPIPYKLKIIDIPRPNYIEIKNSTAKSQAMTDPRLRKLFRLSIDESSSDGEKSSKQLSIPRADPRKKPSIIENSEQKPATLDLQSVTNSSSWYKELSTNQKIFVNQQLATVTSLLKKHQQEKHFGKKFDSSQILGNPILNSIFNNLGVAVDDAGELTNVKNAQDNPLNPSFSVNPDTFTNKIMDGMGMLNPAPIHMGNMGPMGNMPMNPMGGFTPPFPNPDMLPAPGLLGYAPNMPHPPNFGPPNFNANMSMNNGPMNDFGGREADGSFNRNNRGNYRGRGERWGRGGGRDRRNFNEHGGNWQNERH